MKRIMFSLIAVAFTLVGCSSSVDFPDKSAFVESTITQTPTPTPEPTNVPDEEKPVEEEPAKDPIDVFTEKMAGVWGVDSGYFEEFDGTTLIRGEFGSDILPDAHIAKVTELSENKYEVYVEDNGVVDDPDAGFEYHGIDYTVIYDGTTDGFETVFKLKSDDKETLFLRMGDTLEDADKYYWDNFIEDYRKLNAELMGVQDFGSLASGIWYTDDYDEINNWAGSYKLDLGRDGTAYCTGYRNKDTGTYKITGDNKILITFDHCEIDSPGEGWVPVDRFVYTIEMTITGDDAQIKIDAPDVITNLMDGPIHRKAKYS